jgi:hypothetical protein
VVIVIGTIAVFAREEEIDRKGVVDDLPARRVHDAIQLFAVVVARALTGPEGNVVPRRRGFLSIHFELGNEDTSAHLTAGGEVGHLADHKVPRDDFDVVTLVAKPLQVGIKIDQSL